MRTLSLILVLALATVACGQKGPLYLEDETPVERTGDPEDAGGPEAEVADEGDEEDEEDEEDEPAPGAQG